MLNWLRRRLSPPAPVEPERPTWVNELLEAVQKQSRGAVKQGARVEAALAEQADRITELGEMLEREAVGARELAQAELAEQYAPLFDALDALDEAGHLVEEPHLAAGLKLVGERVQGYCAQAGIRRIADTGRTPDARLFRIVGTESRPDMVGGAVSRVVRAAIVHADRVLREGAVIVASSVQHRVEGEDERLGN